MVEKRMPRNKEKLVISTEANNDAEISAFVKSASSSRSSAEHGGDGGDDNGAEDESDGKKKST